MPQPWHWSRAHEKWLVSRASPAQGIPHTAGSLVMRTACSRVGLFSNWNGLKPAGCPGNLQDIKRERYLFKMVTQAVPFKIIWKYGLNLNWRFKVPWNSKCLGCSSFLCLFGSVSVRGPEKGKLACLAADGSAALWGLPRGCGCQRCVTELVAEEK